MMRKSQPKERSRKIRVTPSKNIRGKLPPSTFEKWLRLQVVKPAGTKPEVKAPPDSFAEWIGKRVRKELEFED
ncbi:MAG: hypothetical protein OK422_05155 [Thaumarchaeota archaeon]|nr:hypothetical protein [Nitrososphaerota archaeon]